MPPNSPRATAILRCKVGCLSWSLVFRSSTPASEARQACLLRLLISVFLSRSYPPRVPPFCSSSPEPLSSVAPLPRSRILNLLAAIILFLRSRLPRQTISIHVVGFLRRQTGSAMDSSFRLYNFIRYILFHVVRLHAMFLFVPLALFLLSCVRILFFLVPFYVALGDFAYFHHVRTSEDLGLQKEGYCKEPLRATLHSNCII